MLANVWEKRDILGQILTVLVADRVCSRYGRAGGGSARDAMNRVNQVRKILGDGRGRTAAVYDGCDCVDGGVW